MGVMYNKKRLVTVEIKLRIDKEMDTNLRILFGLDKRLSGVLSYNQWLVMKLKEGILEDIDRINGIRGCIV